MSARAVRAQNNTGGEQRKSDEREEEDEVASIENAFLEPLEVSHDAERSDDVDEAWGHLLEEIDDRGKAGQNEKEANDH